MKIENVVVISLEDYAEYQELKNKKNNVDFDRLKPGSVIKVVYNGDQIAADINDKNPCVIVSVNSGFIFTRNGGYTESGYSETINVIQDGKLASFGSNKQLNCIKEVISY